VKEKMLPLDPKVFLSQHMENSKTSDSNILDFNNSSFGKLG